MKSLDPNFKNKDDTSSNIDDDEEISIVSTPYKSNLKRKFVINDDDGNEEGKFLKLILFNMVSLLHIIYA